MLSQNAIERTCGVLLVVLAVAVVATAAIGEGFSTYEKSFDEALHEVAEDSGLFKAGLVTSFLAGLVGLVLASTMYFAYREHDRPVSLLGGLWLLAFGAAMAGSSVAGSAVLHMADQFDTAAAANSQAIAIGARPAHVLRESSGIVALTVFLPLATLTFGVVIVRSRAVPAWLGWLAVVAGAAMSLFWVPEVGWFIFILGTPLALLWLVVLGGWMLVRGTRRPTPPPEVGPESTLAPAASSAS